MNGQAAIPRSSTSLSGRVALWLTGLTAAAFACVKLYDPDTWWHLAAGRLIWQEGVPRINAFSNIWARHPWNDPEWLFDAVVAALEGLGGPTALVAFQMVMVAAAFGLCLGAALRRLQRPRFWILFPLFAMGLSSSWLRFAVRPHLVSFVGLALCLNLSARGIQGRPLLFGLIGLLWGNCHSGVVFGFAVLLLEAAGSFLEGERRRAARELGDSASFLLGSLVNPNFAYGYVYAVQHLSINDVVPLLEFQPVSLGVNTTFVFLAALVVATLPLSFRRRDFRHVLLAVAFLPLALGVVRLVPKFELVAFPGFCVSVHSLLADRGGRVRRWLAPITALALCLSAIIFVSRDYRYAFALNELGFGINLRRLPEGASRFIGQKNLRGIMYNDYSLGGYLIWRLYPGRGVFQDGRVKAYPREFLPEIRNAFRLDDHGPWRRLMDKYRVEYAVVDRMPYGNGIDAGIQFDRLGWKLVFLEGASSIYVRPGSLNRALEEPWAFRLISPSAEPQNLYSLGQENPALMRTELSRIDPERLIIPSDFLRFAAAAHGAGEGRLCGEFLAGGARAHPRDENFRSGLAKDWCSIPTHQLP